MQALGGIPHGKGVQVSVSESSDATRDATLGYAYPKVALEEQLEAETTSMASGIKQEKNAAGQLVWVARWKANGRDRRKQFPTREQAVAWRDKQVKRRSDSASELPPGVRIVNGRFQARVRYPNGRVEKSFASLAEATHWLSEAKKAIDSALPIPVSPAAREANSAPSEGVAMVAASEAWLGSYSAGRIADPRKNYRAGSEDQHRGRLNRIEEYFGDMPLHLVTVDVVMDFVGWMAARPYTGGVSTLQPREHGLMANEQNTTLWILERTSRYARDRGWVPGTWLIPAGLDITHPLEPVNPAVRGEAYFMPLTEFRAVLPFLDPHQRLAVQIMRLAGLRISEVFGLRVKAANTDDLVLHVEEQAGSWFKMRNADGSVSNVSRVPWTKTTAGTRQAAMPECLAHWIDDYIAEFHGSNPDPEARLIGGRDEQTQSRSLVDCFGVACDNLGITTPIPGTDRTTSPVPHDLRKSFYTDLEGYEDDRGAFLHPSILSYTMGHRIQAIDGAASVSKQVYLVHSALRKRLMAVSSAMQDLVNTTQNEHGWDSWLPESAWDDAVTLALASRELGVEEVGIRRMIRRGQISALPIVGIGAGVGNPIRVSLAEVRAVAEELAQRIPIIEAANMMGVSRQAAAVILDRSGVELQRDPYGNGGNARYITPEDLDVLDETNAGFLDFMAANVDAATAGRRLEDLPYSTVMRLVARRILERVEPPSHLVSLLDPTKVWISNGSIDAANGDRSAWAFARKPRAGGYDPDILARQNLVIESQAAILLDTSTSQIKLLRREGHLDTVRKKNRVYYTVASIKKYKRKLGTGKRSA